VAEDQLKDGGSKLNNKVSLRGCILVLVVSIASSHTIVFFNIELRF
jgi:hypothetical protein